MTPSYAISYAPNSGALHPEMPSYRADARAVCDHSVNIANVIIRKFGVTLSLPTNNGFGPKVVMMTSAGRLAASLRHIVHVVLMGANFQMGGVDASSVVALVANDQSLRYGTVDQFIRQTVYTNVPTANHHDAVTEVRSALPVPTGIGAAGHINLMPHVLGVSGAGRISARLGACLASITELVRVRKERFAASLTDNIRSILSVHLGVTPTQSFRGVTLRGMAVPPGLSLAPSITESAPLRAFRGGVR